MYVRVYACILLLRFRVRFSGYVQSTLSGVVLLLLPFAASSECSECLFSVRAEWLCLLFYSRPVRNCRVVCMLKSSVSLAGALCHRFLNHLAFAIGLVGWCILLFIFLDGL